MSIKRRRMHRTTISARTLGFFRACALASFCACVLVVSCACSRADSPRAATARGYLQIAETEVARAQRLWWNKRLGWYDSRLHDQDRYPLATIWDVTPLFEALDAIAIARPTPAHKAAVERFARGAERYWDPTLRPDPGFAPYPGDRGQVQTWFDDNGWWGLALVIEQLSTA